MKQHSCHHHSIVGRTDENFKNGNKFFDCIRYNYLGIPRESTGENYYNKITGHTE